MSRVLAWLRRFPAANVSASLASAAVVVTAALEGYGVDVPVAEVEHVLVFLAGLVLRSPAGPMGRGLRRAVSSGVNVDGLSRAERDRLAGELNSVERRERRAAQGLLGGDDVG